VQETRLSTTLAVKKSGEIFKIVTDKQVPSWKKDEEEGKNIFERKVILEITNGKFSRF
jgi:hypothetical protein